MGALTGNTISSSYLGLLKTSDNAILNSTLRLIEDGAGTDASIKLSTTQLGLANGTTTVPSLTFSNDSDTGLYYTTNKINATIGGTTKFELGTSSLKLSAYGSGSITGTVTQRLGVTSSGEVVEIPIGAGAVDGSGTAGKITKWTDSDTIGDSIITESSNLIQIGSISSGTLNEATGVKLAIIGDSGGTNDGLIITRDNGSQNQLDQFINIYNDGTSTFLTSGGTSTHGSFDFKSTDDKGDTSTSRLSIDASGNSTFAGKVGIGVSPSARGLEVSGAGALGTILASDGTVNTVLWGDASGSNHGGVGTDNNYGFNIYQNGGVAITIDTSKNVGIGTTSPDAPLHILKAASGANIVTALKLDPDDATVGSGTSIDFNASSTNTGASLVGSRIVGARAGGNASGYLSFYTSPDSSGSEPLERIRITASGNVGIGTNSPTAKLEISGGALPSGTVTNLGISTALTTGRTRTYDAGSLASIGARGDSTAVELVAGSSSTWFTGIGLTARGATAASGTIIGYTSGVEKFRVDADGDFGIGVTNPTNKLHVGGDTLITGGLTVYGNSTIGDNFADAHTINGSTTIRSTNTSTVAVLDVTRGDANNEGANATDFRFVASNRAITTERANMEIYTNDDQAANMGASIGFGGRHTDASTNDSLFATIKSGKVNATSTNYAGYLSFGTAKADSDIIENMRLDYDGKLKLNTYGSGTHTGTATKFLAVDSSGNVIEEATSTIDGSGTANKIVKWSDADTIGDSIMTESSGIQIKTTTDTGVSHGLQIIRSANSDTGYINYQGGAFRFIATDGDPFKIGHVSSSDRVIIDGSGNVGITGTPPTNQYTGGGGWKMLQIGQSSQIAGYGTDDEIGIFQNTYLNTSGVFQAITSDVAGSSIILVDGKISFKNASTSGTAQTTSTRMFIDTDGDIGIGTTSPSGKFMVQDDTAGSPTRIIVSNGGTAQAGTSARMSFYEGTDEKNYIERRRDGSGKLAFVSPADDNPFVFENTSGEFLRFTNSKVGIGTASPTNLLTINDPSANASITDTIPSWWSLVIDRAYSTSSTSAMALIGGTVATSSTGRLYLGNSDDVDNTYIDGGANQMHFSVSGTTAITIDSSQDIGIGTTSPTSKIDVREDANNVYTGYFYNSNTGSTAHGINVQTASTNADAYAFRVNSASNTNALVVKGNANVGIGTASPTNPLSVEATNSDDWVAEFKQGDSTTGESFGVNVFGGTNSSDAAFQVCNQAGTGLLRVRGDGSVGIGTSSPASMLQTHASGSGSNYIRITNDTTGATSGDGFILGITGDENAYLCNYENTDLMISTNDNEAMRIKANGNVGIGSTTPNDLLHVQGDVKIVSGVVKNPLFEVSAFVGSQTNDVAYIHCATPSSTGYNLLHVQGDSDDTPIEAFIVRGDGKVGIGTDSPDYALSVKSTSATQRISVDSRNSGGTAGIIFRKYTLNGADALSGIGEIVTQSNGDMDFDTGTTSATLQMRILANGDLVVGNTVVNPASGFSDQAGLGYDKSAGMLQVATTADDVALQVGKNNASEGDVIAIRKQGTVVGVIGTQTWVVGGSSYGANGAVSIGADRDDGAGQIVFDRATTLNTSIAIDFQNAGTSSGSISFNSSTTAYATSSDYRMKEDYQDFNALEIASKIKMYDFKWKDEDKRSYGVKAHELQDILPDAVTGEKDAEEMQGVDYSKLVPILLKSIQELEARVKELEKEI